MRKIDLPDTPPPLDERIAISDQQMGNIENVLTALSRSLEGLPVVLSQQGEIVATVGAAEMVVAERLAKIADRLWREGGHHLAREVLRFEEENIEEVERANYLIYSAHVTGALTLTVGWQLMISLTQVREEVADARAQLARLLE